MQIREQGEKVEKIYNRPTTAKKEQQVNCQWSLTSDTEGTQKDTEDKVVEKRRASTKCGRMKKRKFFFLWGVRLVVSKAYCCPREE